MGRPADPIEWATKQFDTDGRNPAITKIEEYLQGKHPVAFATPSFRDAFGGQFDSFAYNRLPSVIDAHADRLQIGSVSGPDDAASQMAQEHWDANQMDVRENESTNDALTFGDGFVTVEPHPGDGPPVYWVNDPRLIRVYYSDEIPGKIELAVKRWVGEDKYGYLNIYTGDRIEKFVTKRTVTPGVPIHQRSWVRKEGDEAITLPDNVADTVPVFHIANKARTSTYGKSEVAPLIPLQDALNYTLMSGMVATEFAAFSQKVIMGYEPESEEEETMFENFKLGVDRILALYSEDAKIGEFNPTNINAYIDLAEWWDTTVSRVSRVPVHYLKLTGTPPSGETLRQMEGPFTAKITDQQRQFGYPYGEVVRYGMRLQGQDVPVGSIKVNWEPAAPHSEKEQWELVDMKVRSGLPFEWAIRDIFDQAQIEEILQQRQMDQIQAQRMFDRGNFVLGFGEGEEGDAEA